MLIDVHKFFVYVCGSLAGEKFVSEGEVFTLLGIWRQERKIVSLGRSLAHTFVSTGWHEECERVAARSG